MLGMFSWYKSTVKCPQCAGQMAYRVIDNVTQMRCMDCGHRFHIEGKPSK